MADSPKSKSASAPKRPSLLPLGDHAGKQALSLGAHHFTLIGSRNRSHLHLLSSTISRNHACIITAKSGMYIRDLASRTGVIVNDQKVKEAELHDGDRIQVGSFTFKFQDPQNAFRLDSAPRSPLAMLEMGGRTLTPLDERTILIGRRPGCDITLSASAVSNTHAIIFESDGRRYVRDLGSRTGTQVNGNTVHQQALEIGDQINIGGTAFRYIDAAMSAIGGENVEPLAIDAEFQQAVAQEDSHGPIGLQFDQPEPEQAVESSVPSDIKEAEPIPLIALATETSDAATESPAMDFPNDDAGTEAPPLEPASVIEPLPVEEEIPLVQQDLTVPAVVAEPAEDVGLDFWKPQAEETLTADAPAAETAAHDSVLPPTETVPEPASFASSEIHVEKASVDEAAESATSEMDSLAVEPEASTLEQPAPAIEPDVVEPLESIEAAPVVVEAGQDASASVALEAEQQTLETELTETTSSIAPAAMEEEAHAEEAAQTVETAAESPQSIPQVEPQETTEPEASPIESVAEAESTVGHGGIAEPAESDAGEIDQPASPRVGDIDLSAVNFDAEKAEVPSVEEPAAEARIAELGPLLDLAPPTRDVATTTAAIVESLPPALPEPPSVDVNKRRGRARGKSPTARAPRKKKDEATAALSSEAAANLSSAAETETAVVDTTPVEASSPFVSSQGITSEVQAATTGTALQPVEAGAPETSRTASDVAATGDAPSIPAHEQLSEPAAHEPSSIEPEQQAAPQAAESPNPDVIPDAPPDASPAAASLDPAQSTDLQPPVEIAPLQLDEPDSAVDKTPATHAAELNESSENAAIEFAAPIDEVSTPAEVQPVAEETTQEPIRFETTEPPAASANSTETASVEVPPSDLSDPVQSQASFGVAETTERELPKNQTAPAAEPAPDAVADIPVEFNEPSQEPTEQVGTTGGAFAKHETSAHLNFSAPDAPVTFTAPVIDASAGANELPLDLELRLSQPPSSEVPTEPAPSESVPDETTFSEQISELTSSPEPSGTAEADLAAVPDSLLEFCPIPDVLPELKAPAEEETGFDTGLNLDEPVPAAPEPIPDSSLDLEMPALLDSEPEWEPAGSEPGGAKPEPVTAKPVDRDSADSLPAAKVSESAPAPPNRAPTSPFFGMERDLGTFIGGRPLALAGGLTAAGVAATEAGKSIAHAPAQTPVTPVPAPQPPQASVEDAKENVDLDKLFEGEEPPELFDETAEKLDELPDSFQPIGDLNDSLAEPVAGQHAGVASARSLSPGGGSTSSSAPVAAGTTMATAPTSIGAPSIAGGTSVSTAPSLRSLTADPSALPPKTSNSTSSIPPFAGTRTLSGSASNPFAALTGLRPTEVFSQTTFPPLDERAFRPQPIDVPPVAAAKPSAADLFPPGSGAAGPWTKTGAGASAAAASPSARNLPPPPPSSGKRPESDGRRRWWKNIRVLLPMFFLTLIAAAAITIRFFPPKTVVEGTLQIKGMEDRSIGVFSRRDQVNYIREMLKQPSIREAVLHNLQNQGISPGFLADPAAFEQLADPSNSPYQDGRLVLQRPEMDPRDGQRLFAVMQALYLASKTAAEGTTLTRRQADAATLSAKALGEQANAQQAELKALSNGVKVAAGSAAPDLLRDPASAVDSLQQQNADLQKALDTAAEEVKKRHDAWEQVAGAQSESTNDPRLMEIRQRLMTLKSQLAVARVARRGLSDPAKAFDDAVEQISQELILMATAGDKDPAMAGYLSGARQAASEIQMLLDRQAQDGSQIQLLQSQLGAHRQASLRQVIARDEALKALLQDRDAQAQRYAKASAGGFAEDAAHLRMTLDQLDEKIEARRQSLIASMAVPDDLQQKLEQSISRLQRDRSDNDKKIAADLSHLEIPSAGKLPPADEQLLDGRVAEDIATAQAAHDLYASSTKSSGNDAQGRVGRLEAEIADQQAQLDAYEQRPDEGTPVAAARTALDAAQDAQAKAQAAYAANLDLLASARILKDEQARYQQLLAAKESADRDAQGKQAEADSIPVLVRPDERASVQATRQPDQRVWYLAVALGLIAAVFAIPLWIAARDARHQPPYANMVPVTTEKSQFPIVGDEEHPALT